MAANVTGAIARRSGFTRRAPGECANARPQLRVGGRLVGGKACRDDVELRRGILPARSVGEAPEDLHGRPSRGGASWTGNGTHTC